MKTGVSDLFANPMKTLNKKKESYFGSMIPNVDKVQSKQSSRGLQKST